MELKKKPLQDGFYRTTSPLPLYPGIPEPVDPYAPAEPINTVSQSVASPVVVPYAAAPLVGPDPCRVICPSCHHQMITRVERTINMRTHMMALMLCCIGCLACMCIPYCVDSCRSADHYCTNCGSYLGKYAEDKICP